MRVAAEIALPKEERRGRIFLHFIPTGKSWANLTERSLATLTHQWIRPVAFASVSYLEKCLREYLHSCNEHPRSLVWTKAFDEIMEKIRRGRAASPQTS